MARKGKSFQADPLTARSPKDAVAEVASRSKARAWYVLRHSLKLSNDQIEDIEADAFEKLLCKANNSDDWNRIVDLQAYYLGLIRNLGMEQIRRQTRESPRNVDILDQYPARGDADPAERFSLQAAEREQQARIKQMRDAIARLPKDYREPLEWRLAGFSYDRIAEELDISQPAARKRISRAMARIRTEVTDDP